MCIFKKYVGKKVKIVWQDNDRQKVVIGILKESDGKFITILANVQHNSLSLKCSAILSVTEIKGWA